MNEIELELLAAAEQLLTPLRRGDGIDEVVGERLKAALRAAAAAWEGSSVIPKAAANLFVDLASGIDACSESYGMERDHIRNFADEIADLVRQCVAL
jgi:hypothetical protein